MRQSVKPWHLAIAAVLFALLCGALWRRQNTPPVVSVPAHEAPRGAAPLDEVVP